MDISAQNQLEVVASGEEEIKHKKGQRLHFFLHICLFKLRAGMILRKFYKPHF